MERFRQYQRSAFEQITAEWPAGERLEFARLMVKYVESQDALRTRVRRTPPLTPALTRPRPVTRASSASRPRCERVGGRWGVRARRVVITRRGTGRGGPAPSTMRS